MDDDLKNGLVSLLDSNFGYTGEEKAEVTAERIMRYLRDAGVVKPVRCKDCIHKPHHKGTAVYADDPSDFTCPYLCSADPWAAGVPDDDFFCADGESKEDISQKMKDDPDEVWPGVLTPEEHRAWMEIVGDYDAFMRELEKIVPVRDENGAYRSTYEIFSDLAKELYEVETLDETEE